MQLTTGNGTLTAASYTYDAMSRLASVGSAGFQPAVTASYSRVSGSSLLATTTTGNLTTTRTYDNLNRLTSIGNAGITPTISYSYIYNDHDQRSKATLADGSYWLYTYDQYGQVISGKKYDASNAEIPNQQFGYEFDSIGNRTKSSMGIPARDSIYSSSSLTQYTQRTVPGTIDIAGQANLNAQVTIQRMPLGDTAAAFAKLTGRTNKYFSKDFTFDNSSNPVSDTFRIFAVESANGTDTVSKQNVNVFIPKTPEAYTYSADGKLATRTWSRGVVTTYSYNLAGDLTGITYSDTTPAVAFTYNRLGQQLTVTDAVGSRTFGYNGTLQLTSEAITGIYNKTLSRSYDSLGRSSGMNIGTEYAVGYGYDNLGRFSTVTNGNDTFTYGYLANSNLIQSITYPSTISVTKSYESNRDLVTSIENKYGNSTISKYDYSNDDLGRRTAMGKSGTAFTQADTISYGYNDRSEVTSAVSANIATQNWGFNFDALGNRITSTTSETGTAVQTSYTANNLNQYSLINDGTAKTPSYDFDGNMTSMPADSGSWSLSWDAENRLVSAVKGTTTLEFKYDYGSRRVEKKVIEGGSVSKCERFVYRGYKQIERLNALDSNNILQKFVWAGETMMLSMSDAIGKYYYTQDANKNVSELMATDGTLKAHYEYSPFGKVTVANGDLADDNHFRFSSEHADDETGLVYYNYRYYSPEIGKWLSRDPISEAGSLPWFQMERERRHNKYLLDIFKKYPPIDVQFSNKYPSNIKEISEVILLLEDRINTDVTGRDVAYNYYLFNLNDPILNYDEYGLLSPATWCALQVILNELIVGSFVFYYTRQFSSSIDEYGSLLSPGQEYVKQSGVCFIVLIISKDCNGNLHRNIAYVTEYWEEGIYEIPTPTTPPGTIINNNQL